MTTIGDTRSRRWAGCLLLTILLVIAGCGGGDDTTGASTPSNFDFGTNNPRQATAFGDSITLGVVAGGGVTASNYPNVLQAMLQGLDPAWRVVNRGRAGERTSEGASRLPGVLAADEPGFVLIMEGTNDASFDRSASSIVANLQEMVRRAKDNRSAPIIGTIPPNFRSDPSARAIVDEANRLIRSMASAEGIALAEVFGGMNDRSLFGSPDPLHPNERGYQVLAGIWFEALRRSAPAAPPASEPPVAPPRDLGQRARRRSASAAHRSRRST